MVYRARFLDPATIELEDTKTYYDSQQEGLGDIFVQAVHKTVLLIETFPYAWTLLSKRARRALVPRFPYGIIYRVDGDEILIVAIANSHRKPEYWTKRL